MTVGLSAIEQTWGVDRLGPSERREVARALEEVGVVVEPPLARAAPGDSLELSLRDEESGVRAQVSQAEPRTAPLALAVAGVVLMVVGSLGPWAKDVFATDYGLDRGGALVIAAGGLAALVLALHARRGHVGRLPIFAAALGALSIGMVASEFREVVDDTFVEPAWGIYVAGVGSVLLVVLSMSLLARR